VPSTTRPALRKRDDTLNCFKNQFLTPMRQAQKLYEALLPQALNISHL